MHFRVSATLPEQLSEAGGTLRYDEGMGGLGRTPFSTKHAHSASFSCPGCPLQKVGTVLLPLSICSQ